MLDAKQIRAARALLDWTQERLSKRSGIARATIKNVESGITLPRLETAHAIQHTLEEAGVEFLPSSGVRMKDRMIEILEGKDALRELFDDVYETLHRDGGEVLIAPAQPADACRQYGVEYMVKMMKDREAANIKQRLLVPSDDEGPLTHSLESYRILPKEYRSNYPLYVYANKLALVCQQEPEKIVIINDERFAKAFSKLFNFIWDRTEMPSQKDFMLVTVDALEKGRAS